MSSLTQLFWYWLGYSQTECPPEKETVKEIPRVLPVTATNYLTPELLKETASKLRPVSTSTVGQKKIVC